MDVLGGLQPHKPPLDPPLSFGKDGSSPFNFPFGLRFDKKGFLYVCDFGNNQLVIY